MKLMCKLFGHKPDFNPAYDIRPHCIRCDWQDFEFDKWLHRHSARLEEELNKINRSNLDESENVIIDEDRVNDLWARCLKSNSYTHMGSEIRFDKIADMVIGENQWHMRDQALLTIKAMGKLLTPEKKLEIINVSGVSKHDIDNCYRKDKQ